MTTETILSDAEVALLNETRSLLATVAKRCSAQAWNAETDIGVITRENRPTGADYGRVHALAEAAEHAIFSTLNWANSHHVQPLTDEQLHNRPPAAEFEDDPNEGIEVPVGPLNPEQERAVTT